MFPSKYRAKKYCEEINELWDDELKYNKLETSILIDRIMTEMFALSLEEGKEVLNSISNESISHISGIVWDLIDNEPGIEDVLVNLYEKTKNEDLRKELKDFGIRFGIVSEYDENRLNELLAELDKYWNIFSDERLKGEHPKCADIQEEIVYMLYVMTDEQVRNLFNNANEDKQEQLEYPIDCILPYRPYIFNENYEIDLKLINSIIKEREDCFLYDERSMEDCRSKLLGALGEDEAKAVKFIMSADKKILYWLTEIIEEILDIFHSDEMDKAVDYIIKEGM